MTEGSDGGGDVWNGLVEGFWRRVCWKMTRERILWSVCSRTEDFQMGDGAVGFPGSFLPPASLNQWA